MPEARERAAADTAAKALHSMPGMYGGTEPLPAPEAALGALRTQSALYRELAALASRQRGLITGGDATGLLALLADRQRLTAELVDVGQRLEPVRREWKVVRERFSDAQRAEAEQLLGEVSHALQGVMRTDEEDSRLLAARKQAAAGTLRSSHAVAAAMDAYRTPSGIEHNRLDHLEGPT